MRNNVLDVSKLRSKQNQIDTITRHKINKVIFQAVSVVTLYSLTKYITLKNQKIHTYDIGGELPMTCTNVHRHPCTEIPETERSS